MTVPNSSSTRPTCLRWETRSRLPPELLEWDGNVIKFHVIGSPACHGWAQGFHFRQLNKPARTLFVCLFLGLTSLSSSFHLRFTELNVSSKGKTTGRPDSPETWTLYFYNKNARSAVSVCSVFPKLKSRRFIYLYFRRCWRTYLFSQSFYRILQYPLRWPLSLLPR